jgi:hypothetical protein
LQGLTTTPIPSLVPPPAQVDGRLTVPIDIDHLVAKVRFDVPSQVAEVTATLDLVMDGPEGRPVFDLRQVISSAWFDGRALPPEALAYCDMGAGHEARMRSVDVLCPAGSRHQLELAYGLGTPEAAGARDVEWSPTGDGVAWDLLMSDLEPGRYLEMWFPANLCHDRLAIEVAIEVAGTERPHVLLANGTVVEHRPGLAWTVHYPRTYTSLSPLLVLAPADEVDFRRSTANAAGKQLQVTVAGMGGPGSDLEATAADAAAWLSYFAARYGTWAHGDEFLAVLWGTPRGMEYDGATTTSQPALEHEIFHSWFGRGVKPACASDGWIDEAMATWATAARQAGGGRYAVEELGLDEAPSLLYPAHPWSRHTPREAYSSGGRLLAGVAHMAGGAAPLRSALADWHRSYAGGLATTRQLAEHLGQWCGRELGPWWDRYVYGAGERSG